MKPLLVVEKDRIRYHKETNINSVYRSSLIVPKIKSNKTVITFMNHFLLKRNYPEIVLKITGYKKNGESGDSISYVIDQPIVYKFCLEDLGQLYFCYQVEFFSTRNLFVPFPAVIVNHIGKKSINTVHSYNRILNDSKENENINKVHLREASIDFAMSKKINTFFVLQTGLIDLKDEFIEIFLEQKNSGYKKFHKKIQFNMKKMSIKKFNLSEIFKNEFVEKEILPSEYTLRILQPKQNLFYGRLLVGIEDIQSGSFTGNHSYYDNSQFKEYFNTPKSYRTFPYFLKAKNNIRIYPIMSEGKGIFSVYVNYLKDNKICTKFLEKYNFDNIKTTLSIDIDYLLNKATLKNVSIKTFTIIYSPIDQNKVPTRVNMQLVYGSKLVNIFDASLNVSLVNNQIFMPKGKGSYCWVQMINKVDYFARIGICFSNYLSDDKENEVEISLFDSKGCFESDKIKLSYLDMFELNSEEIKSNDEFIWVVAKSKTPSLQIYTFHTNKDSQISSGEHNF